MKYIFAIFTVVAFCSLAAAKEDTPPKALVQPLSFFVVSDVKIEDGRFIDTESLPNVGYIHRTPDMVITELESVTVGGPARSFMVDKDGKKTELPQQRTLVVRMRPEDAPKFAVLTEHAVGKRLLMMLGDDPLVAPRVDHRIDSQSIQLALGSDQGLKQIQATLELLLKKKEPNQSPEPK